METTHIKYFLYLARSEHMSETADYFNLSQPALSKNIARLEQDLGVKLFDHPGNRIRLNENGKIYLQYAEKAMELLDTAGFAANSISKEIQGQLNIAYYVHSPIVVKAAVEYARENPRVSFSKVDIDGSIEPDIVFFAQSSREALRKLSSWTTEVLFQEKFYLIASKNHEINQRNQKIRLADMREEKFVAFLAENMYRRDALFDICKSVGFYPQIFYRTKDFFEKLLIIEGGCAIGILPRCCLKDAQHICPGLAIYDMEDVDYERMVCARRKQDGQASELTKNFWDFLFGKYQNEFLE